MKSAIVKFTDDPVFHLECYGSLIRIKRLVLVVGMNLVHLNSSIWGD